MTNVDNHFQIGISDYPWDRDKYHEEFPVVELRIGMTAPPNLKTLRRWRRDAPDGFRFIWVALQSFVWPAKKIRGGKKPELEEGEEPRHLGNFQDTPANRRLWQEILACVEAVEADTILLETHASFSPTDENVEAMTAFSTDWGKVPKGVSIAWQPAGFWSREESIKTARELGWQLALDPLVDPADPLPDPGPYFFRMLGSHGIRNSYGDDQLDRLLEIAAPLNDVTVIFKTEDSVGDAARFKKYAALMLE